MRREVDLWEVRVSTACENERRAQLTQSTTSSKFATATGGALLGLVKSNLALLLNFSPKTCSSVLPSLSLFFLASASAFLAAVELPGVGGASNELRSSWSGTSERNWSWERLGGV